MYYEKGSHQSGQSSGSDIESGKKIEMPKMRGRKISEFWDYCRYKYCIQRENHQKNDKKTMVRASLHILNIFTTQTQTHIAKHFFLLLRLDGCYLSKWLTCRKGTSLSNNRFCSVLVAPGHLNMLLTRFSRLTLST